MHHIRRVRSKALHASKQKFIRLWFNGHTCIDFMAEIPNPKMNLNNLEDIKRSKYFKFYCKYKPKFCY